MFAAEQLSSQRAAALQPLLSNLQLLQETFKLPTKKLKHHTETDHMNWGGGGMCGRELRPLVDELQPERADSRCPGPETLPRVSAASSSPPALKTLVGTRGAGGLPLTSDL